jgi:ribokinase
MPVFLGEEIPMGKPAIAVVGSINMDLVVSVEAVPRPGENVFGRDFQAIPGGKGANQAVAAARLGATARMIGSVGADNMGDRLIAGLVENEVDVSGIKRDPKAPSGTALIMVDDGGENSIIIVQGANGQLTTDDVMAHKESILSAAVVLLQLEIPYDTVEAVIQLARAHNVKVVLDAGPPCTAVREAFFDVEVLTPNEAEASALLDTPITDLVSAEVAGQEMLARGAGAAVIKMGSRGAMLVTHDGGQHFPAFEVEPVDTTAAGDAFSAALAVQLAQGASIEAAVLYANAAGAVAVTKFGAQPSLPTRQEVEHLLSQQGG